MILFAPRQNDPNETRTPLTPAITKKWVDAGLQVLIEPGLGVEAFQADQDFVDAGATVLGDGHHAWEDADVVVTLGPPSAQNVGRMKRGAMLVGMLSPTVQHDLVRAATDNGVASVALEFVPRISRAQSMDVLSSQANLGGYKAVLLGASHCPKLMPMMITAAGTLSPGRVFVIGVGVAGLQAIATAKRLGAIVEAYDVRPATKEQVQSLGARFVELPKAGGGETEGGYAKEQTAEERAEQAELMAKHVTGADIVITTAAVFGKAPPMLIPADVVTRMKSGSVLVDLAANPDYGRGNCELTKPGEITQTEGQVTLIGTSNLPATMPVHASQVFANNVYALLQTLVGKDDEGKPTMTIDLEDEIHAGALITREGAVTNDLVRNALEATV